ncbi:Alcohol dehydrogenase superfamily zinc-type [Penicillium robsamsonii]|uniref:Alcohol dehydrogenase superfamily zinc-type n=1 Tax=Penicillium robsamsonii TaxID=1792511 RepID=UPI002547B5B6|nr:Alcohol dehydrogenase superfamily zinc-type [Penicillium robsamsonii]KAJ5836925.1 Alcohol dehydrogenase superfamily zinc-type [Penicillium robsamsonii]
MAETHSNSRTMRSVVFDGHPLKIHVRDVPKAHVVRQTDAVVRVTSAAICGSDLHNYHGVFGSNRVPYPIGHEAIGIVEKVGADVDSVKVGDRVIIPDIPDGIKLDLEPVINPTIALYGEGSIFGNLGGCQAEFVRVPLADKSLIILDEEFEEIEDKDLVVLSDIFPTAWTGVTWSGFQAGDKIAIFGAGPVGLLAAYSAILRGASRVYCIDSVQERLDLAVSIGAIPINFTKGEPSAQILAREPGGVQRTVDCVGEECVNEKLKPDQSFVITQAIKCTSVGGGLGVLGVHLAQPNSNGVERGDTISPNMTFPITLFWGKNMSIRGGAVDSKLFVGPLLELVKSGIANPGFVFSSTIDIEEAPEAYRRFSEHLETKVMIKFC